MMTSNSGDMRSSLAIYLPMSPTVGLILRLIRGDGH